MIAVIAQNFRSSNAFFFQFHFDSSLDHVTVLPSSKSSWWRSVVDLISSSCDLWTLSLQRRKQRTMRGPLGETFVVYSYFLRLFSSNVFLLQIPADITQSLSVTMLLVMARRQIRCELCSSFRDKQYPKKRRQSCIFQSHWRPSGRVIKWEVSRISKIRFYERWVSCLMYLWYSL